jgi:hypothetical protein
MKKSKVKAQLRKIATREAIEKRKSNKPADPFLGVLIPSKRQRESNDNYNSYEEEQDYDY